MAAGPSLPNRPLKSPVRPEPAPGDPGSPTTLLITIHMFLLHLSTYLLRGVLAIMTVGGNAIIAAWQTQRAFQPETFPLFRPPEGTAFPLLPQFESILLQFALQWVVALVLLSLGSPLRLHRPTLRRVTTLCFINMAFAGLPQVVAAMTRTAILVTAETPNFTRATAAPFAAAAFVTFCVFHAGLSLVSDPTETRSTRVSA